MLSLHVSEQRNGCIQLIASFHQMHAELIRMVMMIEPNFARKRLEVERLRRELKFDRVVKQHLQYNQKERTLANAGSSQNGNSFARFPRQRGKNISDEDFVTVTNIQIISKARTQFQQGRYACQIEKLSIFLDQYFD